MSTDRPNPGPDDVRPAGATQPPTGGGPQQRQRRHDDRPHPLRTAHRALRGRYGLAGALAFAGVCAGAALGVRLGHRVYRATGLVRLAAVRAPVLKDTDQSQPLPMFDGVIEAQQEVMAGEETVRAAMADPAWARVAGRRPAISVEQFAAALKVETRHGSDHLRVTYADPDPEVAAVAVRAVIAAYRIAYDAESARAQQERLEGLRHRRDVLTADLRAAADQIRLLGGPADGTGAPVAATLKAAYAAREAQDEIALDHLNEFGYGDAHPLVADLRAAVVDEGAKVARQAAAADEELRRAARERAELAELGTRAAQLRQGLDEVTNRLDLLTTEASLGSRLTVVSDGDRPMTPLLDTRARAAAAGGAAGGAAPVLLLVLLSSARRRYRNPIEVAEDLAGRVPFVAVVPAVDRRAAGGAAARAVHQLRVRLHRPLTPGARVYLVTAPTAGNGTSAVALSLGLSFATAGHRTLLVDGNLAGRGLSRRFGTNDAPGFSDVAEGSDLPFGTLGAGLHFMPAGRRRPQDAYGLAADHVRTVLAGARAQFDIILIDGDPLLVGVASAVMAHPVDGVILTLARGQSHSSVREAVRALEQQGATIAGCVFNRASGTGGSAPHWTPAALRLVAARSDRACRFGPLVASTLSSLGLSDGPDLNLVVPAPDATSVDGSPPPLGNPGELLNEATLPTGTGAWPIGEGEMPTGDGALPIDEVAWPMGPDPLPVGAEALPIGDGELPVGADASPVGEAALPVGSDALPAGEATLSIDLDALPNSEGALAAGETPLSIALDALPVVGEAVPVGEAKLPVRAAKGRAPASPAPRGQKKPQSPKAPKKPRKPKSPAKRAA